MMSKERKSAIIAGSQRDKQDVGSSEVQIALLDERIKQISEHLKSFPKDHHSREGLMRLVGERKRFLHYLQRTDKSRYDAVMQRSEV